jgi:hypothetical protein
MSRGLAYDLEDPPADSLAALSSTSRDLAGGRAARESTATAMIVARAARAARRGEQSVPKAGAAGGSRCHQRRSPFGGVFGGGHGRAGGVLLPDLKRMDLALICAGLLQRYVPGGL